MKRGTEYLEEYKKQLQYRLHASEALDSTSFQAEENRFFSAHSQYQDFKTIVWPILEPLKSVDEGGNECNEEEKMGGEVKLERSDSSYTEKTRKSFTGRARLTYKDGSAYEGDVLLGLRDGIGTMKYADGKVYIGEFRDDKRKGRGLLKQGQGVRERKLYCGTFQNDSVMVDKHTQLW